MKLKAKQLKQIALVISAIGIVIALYTNHYNDKHPLNQNDYGVYLGLGITLIGLLLQVIWSKRK